MSHGRLRMVVFLLTIIAGSGSISKYGNKRRLSSFDLMYGKNTGNKNNQNVQRRSTVFEVACWLNNRTLVTYDPSKYICCNGLLKTTSDHDMCCRGTVIDGRAHQCCDNEIVSSSDGCCPDNVCCNSTLHPSIRNTKCCGNNIYNNKTHMCCKGNIQPAYGSDNGKGACCQNTSYHVDCHKCGNNFKLIEVFDVSKEICCGGKIMVKKYGNSSACCQNMIMNTDFDKCKENNIVQKRDHGFKTDYAILHLNLTERASRKNESAAEKEQDVNRGEESDYVIAILTPVLGAVVLTGIGVLYCRWRFKTCYKLSYAKLKSGIILRELSNGESTQFCSVCEDKETSLVLENAEFLVDYIKLNSIDIDKSMSNINHFLPKKHLRNTSNFIESYFIENSTQTGTENQTFPRTIFGQPFEHKFMLDEENPSLEIPDSDVKLTLPKSFTQTRQVEVNCSCFHSLPDLRKKLDIPDDEELASPVSEFDITGYTILPEHACVVIPFIGKERDLIVKKFQSDEGLNTIAQSVIIPKKTKENEDLKLFYTVEGKFVIIHTHSFSGFYCTKNRHKRDVDLSIRAFIFGSYKKINRKYSVDVSVYIADEIFELKAYQKNMLKNEKNKEQLKDITLCMPLVDLDEQDFIEACLLAGTDWIHRKHPKEDRPIQPERKELRLEYIAQKCTKCKNFNPREGEIPFHTEWYLTAKDGEVPSEDFEFTVDLNICKRGTDCKEENSIYIASLPLRKSDRLPVKEDYTGAMAPSVPVQESCSYIYQREQSQQMSLSAGMHGSSLVRGERSQPPVHSFSESDLPRAHNRQLDTRQCPGPELSTPYGDLNSDTV